jgi:hypothetical protein
VSRQAGHFFFEPRGYDEVNQATFEYKEDIKVGYNLRRKMVLLSIWAAVPVILLIEPSGFGAFAPHTDLAGFIRHTGWCWLWVGVGGLAARTLQLCLMRDLQTGLVWCTKILTDPFHDLWLYWRAPLQLMRGELRDVAHESGTGG